jgi:lipid-binding SYLF domain-containing protein
MLVAAVTLVIVPQLGLADTATKINRDVDSALQKLYTGTPAVKELSELAKGILVFPFVIKGGWIVGGQYGVGALREEDKTVGYYKTVSVSLGLQFGAQSFGYALFFMTYSDLNNFKQNSGWDFALGQSVIVVNAGAAHSLLTTEDKDEIYAFIFNQEGLMSGLDLQAFKIIPFTPAQ